MGKFNKMQKPPKEEGDEGGEGKGKGKKTGEGMMDYLARQAKAGAAAGRSLAGAVVSPGGAGSLGTQSVNYGVSGAYSAGHGLLRNTTTSSSEEAPKEAEAQEGQDQDQTTAEAQPTQPVDVAAEQERATREASAGGTPSASRFRPRERVNSSTNAGASP